MQQSTEAMYVHVPFCKTICHYCDFYKLCYRQEFISIYLSGLKQEIEAYQPNQCQSIYVGGGTPSALSHTELSELLSYLSPYRAEGCEYTFEINPDDFDGALLELLLHYGVNRFSVGVQTFDDTLLHFLNRRHDSKKAFQTLQLLSDQGCNFSADLIYGIPNQSLASVLRDVEQLIALKVPHISTYSLQIEQHTYFSIHQIESLDDDTLRDYYDAIVTRLQAAGYQRYEVSNFALPGYESRHNLVYWRAGTYYGFGPGASGYLGDVRYKNTKQLPQYSKGNRIAEETKLSQGDQEFEFLMLGLRLEEGISFAQYEERFQQDFMTNYRNSVEELVGRNLIQVTSERLKVTQDGFYILHSILLTLTKNRSYGF